MSCSLATIAEFCPAAEAHVAKPNLLAQLATNLLREWRTRRDLRALEQLDDRALRGIGIGPGGLEDAVRHGRSMKPIQIAWWRPPNGCYRSCNQRAARFDRSERVRGAGGNVGSAR